jgi:hypothetical protein
MGFLYDYSRNSALEALLASTKGNALQGDPLSISAGSLPGPLAALYAHSANNALASLLGAPNPLEFRGMLEGLGMPRPAPAVKRRVYFAFKFDDVMRVNNVRQAWKIDHPDNQHMRSFYDSSLWAKKQIEGDRALKELMREGVEHTSAVCVLIGTATWSSRWVKYEIARSVIDKRGLLAVHLNSLNHHQRRRPDPLGLNPLRLMGIYKSSTGKLYLFECRQVVVNYLTGQSEWQWHQYADYALPVSLPRYLAEPLVGYVQPLSAGALEYDFVADVGHKNIGAWIDHAAQAVGR